MTNQENDSSSKKRAQFEEEVVEVTRAFEESTLQHAEFEDKVVLKLQKLVVVSENTCYNLG